MRGLELIAGLTLAALVLIATRRWTLPRWRTLVLLLSVVTLGFLRLDLPSIHCIAEGFFSRASWAFLKTPMALKLAVVFLPALLVGRVFCGYVCPKGAAQELLFLRRLKLRVPRRLDRALRLLPYLSLAALVVFPMYCSYRLWTDLDPFLWLFQGHGHVPGLILLGLLIPSSVVLHRPFCRYLCPMVPVFRLMSRVAPARRWSDRERCRACKAGVRSCDYDVIDLKPPKHPRGDDPKALNPACAFNNQECLQCGQCQAKCPRNAIH